MMLSIGQRRSSFSTKIQMIVINIAVTAFALLILFSNFPAGLTIRHQHIGNHQHHTLRQVEYRLERDYVRRLQADKNISEDGQKLLNVTFEYEINYDESMLSLRQSVFEFEKTLIDDLNDKFGVGSSAKLFDNGTLANTIQKIGNQFRISYIDSKPFSLQRECSNFEIVASKTRNDSMVCQTIQTSIVASVANSINEYVFGRMTYLEIQNYSSDFSNNSIGVWFDYPFDVKGTLLVTMYNAPGPMDSMPKGIFIRSMSDQMNISFRGDASNNMYELAPWSDGVQILFENFIASDSTLSKNETSTNEVVILITGLCRRASSNDCASTSFDSFLMRNTDQYNSSLLSTMKQSNGSYFDVISKIDISQPNWILSETNDKDTEKSTNGIEVNNAAASQPQNSLKSYSLLITCFCILLGLSILIMVVAILLAAVKVHRRNSQSTFKVNKQVENNKHIENNEMIGGPTISPAKGVKNTENDNDDILTDSDEGHSKTGNYLNYSTNQQNTSRENNPVDESVISDIVSVDEFRDDFSFMHSTDLPRDNHQSATLTPVFPESEPTPWVHVSNHSGSTQQISNLTSSFLRRNQSVTK